MKLIPTIFFFLASNIYAQEVFLEECPYLDSETSIKNIFRTHDCNQIAKGIAKKKSFSEIILPQNRRDLKQKDELTFPWTDDFPYLYGLNRKIMHDLYFYKSEWSSTPDILIEDLSILKEFKNFIHIPYLKEYPYYTDGRGICKILDMFPSIKLVTLHSDDLRKTSVDNCLNRANIEGVIISGDFKGFNFFKPRTKIIGIEYYTGDLKRLAYFKRLKYLGISSSSTSLNGLESLYSLTELTHLSINTGSNMEDISKVGLFRNLTFLNITCTNKERLKSPYALGCQKSKLTNISFLRELPWLTHLNLSYHNIKDLSPIAHLKRLTKLKVRGNKITSIPNLHFPGNIHYLDISGNRIQNLSGIEHFKSLDFLNISGNLLNSLEGIHSLPIQFLNASNNPLQESERNEMPSLRFLNLDGGGGSPSIDFTGYGLYGKTFSDEEANREYITETFFHNYTLSPQESALNNCKTMPSISIDLDLTPFTGLEFLSVKNNNFGKLPNYSYLKKLKYLNLERNSLTEFSSVKLPLSLKSLHLNINEISKLPNLSDLKSLEQLYLKSNNLIDISNIHFISNRVIELDLSSNLLNNLTQLTSNFNYSNSMYFESFIKVYDNPVIRDQKHCPISPELHLSHQCKNHIQGQGNIELSKNPRAPNKCSITYLDFEPRKRPFLQRFEDWFEN